MGDYVGRAIDESGVDVKKREHPEYKRLYSKLQNELTASGAIDIFCVHEAGHLIFFRKAGYTTFIFRGPTMTYNPWKPCKDESERYNYYIAAVETPEIDRLVHYDDRTLLGLARGAAAAELFNEIRQQCAPIPIDKSSDFDGFDNHCRKALRYDPDIGYDASGRWRRARAEVTPYLHNPANEHEIQRATAEVKQQCFNL